MPHVTYSYQPLPSSSLNSNPLVSLGPRSYANSTKVRWCEVLILHLEDLYNAALTVTSSSTLAEKVLPIALCTLKHEDHNAFCSAFDSARKAVLRCSVELVRRNSDFGSETPAGAILQHLPVEVRLVFTLRFLLRLSRGEASELLGVSEHAVDELTRDACLSLAGSVHTTSHEGTTHLPDRLAA